MSIAQIEVEYLPMQIKGTAMYQEVLSEEDQLSKAHPFDAGWDVRSREYKTISSGTRVVVETNVRLKIPSGYEIQVRPRSGLAATHGVTVLNTPGTIDANYTGVVKVILINHSRLTIDINAGDRIAQLVVAPVQLAEFNKVTSVEHEGRGENGLGSSGR